VLVVNKITSSLMTLAPSYMRPQHEAELTGSHALVASKYVRATFQKMVFANCDQGIPVLVPHFGSFVELSTGMVGSIYAAA